MSGTAWLWTQLVLYGIGFLCGLIFLVTHRPSSRSTLTALRYTGWVIPYTALLGLLLFLVVTNPVPPPNGQVLRRGFYTIGLLAMDASVVVLLVSWLRFVHEERKRPSKLCTRCGGSGLMPRPAQEGERR